MGMAQVNQSHAAGYLPDVLLKAHHTAMVSCAGPRPAMKLALAILLLAAALHACSGQTTGTVTWHAVQNND